MNSILIKLNSNINTKQLNLIQPSNLVGLKMMYLVDMSVKIQNCMVLTNGMKLKLLSSLHGNVNKEIKYKLIENIINEFINSSSLLDNKLIVKSVLLRNFKEYFDYDIDYPIIVENLINVLEKMDQLLKHE